jgi:Na+/H+ antiporter NhaD/arsenite permease-like protein
VREKETVLETWKIDGLPNLFFLAVILGAVFVEQPPFLREGLMLAAAAGSYFTTKKSVHAANDFNFHPIQEVTVLFAGIFATMMPALAWLDHHAASLLGQNPSPGIFYWGTGGLSSALDNAPTYLGFLSALQGVTGTKNVPSLLASHAPHLLAISIASVFFGAATYIGNGPNFMVKAIAGQNGVRMPSFLGFILKFSLPFLLPVLITVWLLFFRG